MANAPASGVEKTLDLERPQTYYRKPEHDPSSMRGYDRTPQRGDQPQSMDGVAFDSGYIQEPSLGLK